MHGIPKWIKSMTRVFCTVSGESGSRRDWSFPDLLRHAIRCADTHGLPSSEGYLGGLDVERELAAWQGYYFSALTGITDKGEREVAFMAVENGITFRFPL
jgi:hypothetical protein